MLKILLLGVAFIWIYGVEFKVTKGWNLLGSSEKISNLALFKYQGIDMIWAFDNQKKRWKVYLADKNISLHFDSLKEIPAKSGFWVHSSKDGNITTDLCHLDLKALGFQIQYTYCSYSAGDLGRFWGVEEGFFETPTDQKNEKALELKANYIHCGVFPKAQIETWGGESPCYEAHVYWGKIV